MKGILLSCAVVLAWIYVGTIIADKYNNSLGWGGYVTTFAGLAGIVYGLARKSSKICTGSAAVAGVGLLALLFVLPGGF